MTFTLKDTKNLVQAVVEALEPKFEQIDKRFEQVDKRFEQIDQRFEQVDKRFEQIDQRFEQVDKRFEQIDQRFEQVDKRFEQVDQRFEQVDEKFLGMNIEIGEMFKQVATKKDLKALREEFTNRLDILEERHEQLAGNVAVIGSKMVQGFQNIEEEFAEQKKIFKQACDYTGTLTGKMQNHEIRITKLEMSG